jgi:HAD superfamily hydrolase (TIGR01509 family)
MEKAVLFDMDGILYDSELQYARVTEQVMRNLGYTGPSEALYDTIGCTADGTWQILYDLLDGNCSRHEIEMAWKEYNQSHPIDYRAIMFDDIPETLRTLKENGFRMACCSSSSKRVILDSLRDMGIENYFDVVISGEEIDHPKPEPDIYLLAARQLNTLPENCVVYEDSRIGIEAGRRAGMKVIGRRDTRFNQNQSAAHCLVENAGEMCRIACQGRIPSDGKSYKN